MKRITALLLLLIFTNIAVAHPFDSGGGSASSSEEIDLTMIIMVVIVAGVSALLVADILADDSNDSQDALAGDEEEILSEQTGVDWNLLNESAEQAPLPLLAISVFPNDNDRNLATYFSNLITRGDGLYYDVYSSPVSFGQMNPAEAATTGFSFLDCQWFIAIGSDGLELHSENSETPLWLFNAAEWDSAMVREASSSFLEFSMNPDR